MNRQQVKRPLDSPPGEQRQQPTILDLIQPGDVSALGEYAYKGLTAPLQIGGAIGERFGEHITSGVPDISMLDRVAKMLYDVPSPSKQEQLNVATARANLADPELQSRIQEAKLAAQPTPGGTSRESAMSQLRESAGPDWNEQEAQKRAEAQKYADDVRQGFRGHREGFESGGTFSIPSAVREHTDTPVGWRPAINAPQNIRDEYMRDVQEAILMSKLGAPQQEREMHEAEMANRLAVARLQAESSPGSRWDEMVENYPKFQEMLAGQLEQKLRAKQAEVEGVIASTGEKWSPQESALFLQNALAQVRREHEQTINNYMMQRYDPNFMFSGGGNFGG